MKKVLLLSIVSVLFSLLCFCHISFATEFTPTACPDLSAKIFYINTQQAILYVSANHYNQKGIGFDKFEVRNIFHKDTQKINLTLEMAKGSMPHLRLAIPLQMDKKISPFFLLSTRKSGWIEKINKEWTWSAEKSSKGILVFKSYIDSDCKKVLNVLKINMTNNNAELSSHPGKKFPVSWNSNHLILHGLSGKGGNIFLFNSYYRKIGGTEASQYYNANSCVTVLEHTVDYWCNLRIFPITEKFYLIGIE